jgi:hypothetical protein
MFEGPAIPAESTFSRSFAFSGSEDRTQATLFVSNDLLGSFRSFKDALGSFGEFLRGPATPANENRGGTNVPPLRARKIKLSKICGLDLQPLTAPRAGSVCSVHALRRDARTRRHLSLWFQ